MVDVELEYINIKTGKVSKVIGIEDNTIYVEDISGGLFFCYIGFFPKRFKENTEINRLLYG